MKPSVSILVLLAAAMAAAPSPAATQAPSFARYEVILARMPFGIEPVAAPSGAQAAPPAMPAESFTKNLKMCAVTRHALTGKLQVGLIDNATKKNYFIPVGQEEDGIAVVEADYDGEKALLRKGAEEAWIGMNDAGNAMAVPPAPAPLGRGLGALPTIDRRPVPRRNAGGAASVAAPVPPPEPVHKGEALVKHLEEYQMELIRAGGEKGPALPMELTPEMDAQLVKEGVLPPNE